MKKHFLGIIIFALVEVLFASKIAMAQSQVNASFFKNLEQKNDYEYYIQSFSELINGSPYSTRGNSVSAINKICDKYKNSKNYNFYPVWANEAVEYSCKYSKTMEELLVKNKKPFGYGHCKNLEKAILIFENAKNTPEYIETKIVSDNFIYNMKNTLNNRFGHSWSGGWYGPDSYDYKCS